MSDLPLVCHDDRRRDAVRAAGHVAGIDYVEVETGDGGAPQLRVYFLGKVPAAGAAPLFADENIRIEGGRRVRDLHGTIVEFHHALTDERDDWAVIALDRAGDHSVYTLRLVEDAADPVSMDPPRRFDPRYAAARFSFAAGGPVAVDCAPWPPHSLVRQTPPDLNYLAKDYASFRQMLLDRLAVTLPDWRERHSADLYVTLVEVLAYVGDQLSYFQDAAATEAYLGTARRRISVRRHARLVDYLPHEGCNARAWVCVEVEGIVRQEAEAVSFITRPQGLADGAAALPSDALRGMPRDHYEVFEPLVEAGRTTIHQRDIRRPRNLARRLRDERGALMRELRDRLSAETTDLLGRADGPAEELPALIAALARDLDRLLSDSGLALLDRRGVARIIAHHGTSNVVRGPMARRHNRAQLETAFPDELARPATLVFRAAHNAIPFYTWGQAVCHLPAGATRATLRDEWDGLPDGPRALRYLRPGDVLIL
jgi:hypothetical protein